MTKIKNPILPGFNPDPSICRVEDDFYIATSTFEWYPGVQIWHSRNLQDWTLMARPLAEERLLRLEGIQSSGGIWAPCLSYCDGQFYLVYTVVKTWRSEASNNNDSFKDSHNFITRSSSVHGPWTDPVYVNSSGFDPSLFHDDDGKSWFLNMIWDHRCTPTFFKGILLQEYDKKEQTLTGPVKNIFKGSALGQTEAPHIYKRNGWYYLMVAEGGTGYAHAVTLARSREITGPYTVHPCNPLLESLENRTRDLEQIHAGRQGKPWTPPAGFYTRPQKAGHASICPLSNEEWVLIHLSSRPLPGTVSCPLGRETSLQKLVWKEDDWPYIIDKKGEVNHLAAGETELVWTYPGQEPSGKHSFSFLDNFEENRVNNNFRFLRRSPGKDMDLHSRRGWLRIRGRESMISTFTQTVAAVSVSSFHYAVRTRLDFSPESFQQMAGLLVRYDERNQYYLRVSYTEDRQQRCLGLVRILHGTPAFPQNEILLQKGESISLKFAAQGKTGFFYWTYEDVPLESPSWKKIPGDLDMSLLSDDMSKPMGFTGTFAGLACHDHSGRRIHADFSYFEYRNL